MRDNPIEYVDSFGHLGHVITNQLTDNADILKRQTDFVRQVNNVLCFFSKHMGVNGKMLQPNAAPFPFASYRGVNGKILAAQVPTGTPFRCVPAHLLPWESTTSRFAGMTWNVQKPGNGKHRGAIEFHPPTLQQKSTARCTQAYLGKPCANVIVKSRKPSAVTA